MLLMPHITFGLIGLIFVIALAAIAFRTKTSTLYSKITISILAIVVLLQVVLGFQLLSGAKGVLTSHEANGFLVVLLSLVMGGITCMSARKQRTLPT
jgi:heme A synthase